MAQPARATIDIRTSRLGASAQWVFFDAGSIELSAAEDPLHDREGRPLVLQLPVSISWADDAPGRDLIEVRLETAFPTGETYSLNVVSVKQGVEAPVLNGYEFGVIPVSPRWAVGVRTDQDGPSAIDLSRIYRIRTLAPAGGLDVGP